jgi:hypothetical protein
MGVLTGTLGKWLGKEGDLLKNIMDRYNGSSNKTNLGDMKWVHPSLLE